MTRRRYLLVMAVLATTAVLMMTALSTALREASRMPVILAEEGLPFLGALEDFELDSATGQLVDLEKMAGKVWVADFIFTSCAGVCPVMTGAMAGLQRSFEGDERVQFVSVTVDPETDTPEVLNKYAERYEADNEQWHFLTGDLDDIHALATQNFKVGSLDEPINHSSRFILVDATGFIRGYYIGTDPEDVAELEIAIRQLLDTDAS